LRIFEKVDDHGKYLKSGARVGRGLNYLKDWDGEANKNAKKALVASAYDAKKKNQNLMYGKSKSGKLVKLAKGAGIAGLGLSLIDAVGNIDEKDAVGALNQFVVEDSFPMAAGDFMVNGIVPQDHLKELIHKRGQMISDLGKGKVNLRPIRPYSLQSFDLNSNKE